jgi:hypothetical protein
VDQLRQKLGVKETTTEEKNAKRRLQWLGHLACMLNGIVPKKILFGWFCQPRPRCGPKKRWRDEIHGDLKTIGVDKKEWYEVSMTSRSDWRAIYITQFDTFANMNISHKNNIERPFCHMRHLPNDPGEDEACYSQQRGAVHCTTCGRWFL